MRKLIVFGVLAAALIGTAPTAAAAPVVPTCLISNGAGFTKSLLCVELVDGPHGRLGSGSYSSGGQGTHWLTETVEYRALGRAWLPMAVANADGTGPLKAQTRPVALPAPGALRACTRVGTGTNGKQTSELCSNPD